ncbi:hypothetical protein I204_02448 [Kwoniella mangroviensis CBS 8886]|nr:hypothetical protein I204_02448 [Kwoniella mangroviensis CBS 8886]
MFAQSLFLLALMISPVFSATHTVSVANNKSLTFEPSEVKAELGDIIDTVNGSKLMLCYYYFIVVLYLVNDSKPIWVYCATGQHCQNGMVMAVNAPTSGNTFSAFQAKAMGGENATTAGNSTGSASTSGSASSSTAAISGADGSAGVTVSNTTAAADSSASASASSTNGTSSSSSSDSSASSLDINFLPISMIALLALWFTSV